MALPRFAAAATLTMLLGGTVSADSGELPLDVRRALASGDVSGALPWLEQAAGQGHADAALTLGKLYRGGHGVVRDDATAIGYLAQSAATGSAEAAWLLASLHERAGRVDDAERLFAQAAAAGHRRAAARMNTATSSAQGEASHASNTSSDLFDAIDHVPASAGLINRLRADTPTLDEGGATPLIHAVKGGHADWAALLLDRRDAIQPTIDAVDHTGNAAIHYAVEDPALLALLLDAGASPDRRDARGACPLHLAAGRGETNAARLLVSRGADANARDRNGWTPRMIAQRGSNTELMQVLGATADNTTEEDLRSTRADQLVHAVRTGDANRTAELLNRGAHPDAMDSLGRRPIVVAVEYGQAASLDMLLSANASLDAQPGVMTPLMAASARGNAPMVRRMLSAGASANVIDVDGWTALHHAVDADCSACVAPLMRAGADPERPDAEGATPVIIAVRRAHPDTTMLLLAAQVDVDKQDASGRTALWWAVMTAQHSLVRELLTLGATLTPDDEGVAPLHVAARSGNPVTVDQILNASGADADLIDVRTRTGNTPLMLAAWGDHRNVVQTLIDRRATVDARNAVGDTPLMVAIRAAASHSAAALVAAGASLDRHNDNGQSARSLMQAIDEPEWHAMLANAPSPISSMLERLTHR